MTNRNSSGKNSPFLLKPAGKDYLWGGNRLNDDFSKGIDLKPLAETWECSTHPDGPSRVASGAHTGALLADVLRTHPSYLGTHPDGTDGLPILIKFIDAKRDLSVQVHPDDTYAREQEHEPRGKSEMWYVLDAAKDARLVYGFRHDMTKADLEESLRKGTVEKYLQKVPVQRDDVFYIKAGTVHAIGAGVLIAEIQESSNLTYRMYDYNRVDKNGNPRELHIEKSLAVANLKGSAEPRQPMRVLRYREGCAFGVPVPVPVFSGGAAAGKYGALPKDGGFPDGQQFFSGAAVHQRVRHGTLGREGRSPVAAVFPGRLYFCTGGFCSHEAARKSTVPEGELLRKQKETRMMDQKIINEYARWKQLATEDVDLARELGEIEGKEDQIVDAFYRDLEFGTGGLRGVIGAGTNRMNVYTVAKASQGLADYVIKHFPAEQRRIAVSYDSRIKSDLFARHRFRCVCGKRHCRAYISRAHAHPLPVLCGAGITLRGRHHGDGIPQSVQIQRIQGVRRRRLPDHHGGCGCHPGGD